MSAEIHADPRESPSAPREGGANSRESRADILARILARKREEVAAAKLAVPPQALQAQIARQSPPRDFLGAIRQKIAAGKPAVISEIKRASPSAGAIAVSLDPAAVARGYEAAGAACLSVLTDRDFFQGSPADLVAARSACNLPVIRKDFTIDAYQVYEARAMGADAVLFIVGAAPIDEFRAMEQIASDLGLTVLVEVHTEAQFADALTLKSPLIGVNNRDLHSFSVDVNRSINFAGRLPPNRILVSESGISSPEQVAHLRSAHIHAFLVGTAFVQDSDPGRALSALFGK